jgi:glycosyltransferase involved in cell wall biosynthesis
VGQREPEATLSTEAGRRPGLRGIDLLRDPTVTVIIPALNEAKNLPHVLERLPAVDEVILVDGGSVDGTEAVARSLRPDIRVITQSRRGKGNALACGFAAASGDIVVMIDADGSTDPGEIPSFVNALRAGADFAKGTRFTDAGGSADITTLRKLGNRALGWSVNLLFRTRYSDLCYGYNAFWRYCLPAFALDAESQAPAGKDRIWGDGFEIETLLNLRAARAGLRVAEVSSFEHVRIHGTSNLNAWTDGIRVLRTILREWPRKSSYDREREIRGARHTADQRCPGERGKTPAFSHRQRTAQVGSTQVSPFPTPESVVP